MSAESWAADEAHWLRRRAEAGDSEAAAAFTILSQPWCAARVARHISDDGSIYFSEILTGGWSTGERAMLGLAAHLWNSSERNLIDLDYLLRGLSEDWLAVALDAMAARHGSPLPFGGRS